jgi:phage N-6-adenine-methyltransferase
LKTNASLTSLQLQTRIPTVAEIINEGREDQKRLVTGSRENLLAWYRQADRLRMLKNHHGLRGDALIQAARQMNIDRATAYQLIRLSVEKAEAVLERCDEEAEKDLCFTYPGIRKLFHLANIDVVSMNFGQHTDEHPTPWPIVRAFSPPNGFDLDPAATSENAKAPRFYTKAEDGLKQHWEGDVWLNPPYGNTNIAEWLRRSLEFAWTGGGTVTALVPARTDTDWFAQYASRSEITFLTGRIQFEGSPGAAPFASMICKFSGKSRRNSSKLDVRVMPAPN